MGVDLQYEPEAISLPGNSLSGAGIAETGLAETGMAARPGPVADLSWPGEGRDQDGRGPAGLDTDA
jgi:hypothetical protein